MTEQQLIEAMAKLPADLVHLLKESLYRHNPFSGGAYLDDWGTPAAKTLVDLMASESHVIVPISLVEELITASHIAAGEVHTDLYRKCADEATGIINQNRGLRGMRPFDDEEPAL